MAVTQCIPLATEEYRNGSRRGGRTHTRRWLVTFDSQASGNAYRAANATDPGNPGYYVLQPGTYDIETGLPVVDNGAFNLPGDDSGLNWIAWADELADPIAGSNTEPWLWKDRVHRSFRTYPVPMFLDFSTTPQVICNSAGDMPHTPLMQELSNPLLRVQRTRRPSEFSYKTAGECIGSINQASFTIKAISGDITVPAEEAILRSVVAEDDLYAGTVPATKIYSITMEIEIKGQYPPTATDTNGTVAKFKHVLLEDRGYNVWVAGVKSRAKVKMNGKTVESPSPVWLTNTGTEHTLTGVPATDFAGLATKFRAFVRAPIKDWSSFMI